MSVKSDPALDNVLAELERLRARCDTLEERLRLVEDGDAPRIEEENVAHLERASQGVMRQDTFGPAMKRTSASGHMNSVNKALSMLGLVPEKSADEVQAQELATQGHKHALGKALDMLGIAPQDKKDEGQEERTKQNHKQAMGKALEMMGKAPPPEPTPDVVPEPEPEPEPESGPAAEPERDVPRWESEADVWGPDEPEAVSLHEAVDVSLETPKGAADHAVPLLNGAVLVVAGGAALHAAGLVSLPGQGAGMPWTEAAMGVASVLLGALALAWRRASIHLRAIIGGAAVLLLNAFALRIVSDRPAGPLPLLGAFTVASALGARLVMATRHPLAIFIGLAAALPLPLWLAPGNTVLALAYAVPLNAAVGFCALRMNRLQPSVLAAACTAMLIGVAPAALAWPYAGTLAALYLAVSLAAPFHHRRPSKAAALLALIGFGFIAWAVHGLYDGPGLIRAAALFLPATAAALVAGKLHRREELMRGVLKAGAVALILSALPLGFSGHTLAAVTLFVSLLFAVFAFATYDAYLRAAGALLLVVGTAILVAQPPLPALWFGAAVVATVLFAVRAKGPNPVALSLLLGALAHGSLLASIALVAPPVSIPLIWGGLALAYGVTGRKADLELLRGGAALAAGAAGVWALLGMPVNALLLGVTGALIAPHVWLTRGAPRIAGLYLLLTEVVVVAALLIGLPAPVGVLAVLPLIGAMVLPVWREQARTLRAHARFLTLLLMARCLFPDFLAYAVAAPWLNLRFVAMLAAMVPALVIVRCGKTGRGAAAGLATLVSAVAVAVEASTWAAGLGAILPAAAICGLLWQTENGPEDDAPYVIEPEPETPE